MDKKYIIYGIVGVAIIIFFYLLMNRNVVKSNRPTLTLYYSTECSHCHAFMPIWDEIYKNSSKLDINMRKINCQEEKCDGIDGVPTLVLTKIDGTKVIYDGKRTEKDLETFINSNK